MRLIYEVPGRPQDRLVLGDDDRLDSNNPIVEGGGTFEVADRRARELLAQLYPSVRPADEDDDEAATTVAIVPAEPAAAANPVAAANRIDSGSGAAKSRARKSRAKT